ncbi:MAG: DUF3347 domain-containing protein [Ferruginibacter sp.]
MKSKIQAHPYSLIIGAGKKLFLIVAFVATAFVQQSAAQSGTTQQQDAIPSSQFSTILNAYYGIKNALVNSDATVAATKANELVKAVDAIDMKTFTDAGHNAFMATQGNLKSTAQAIAASNKIEVQRASFSTLSNNMYTLAKAVKLTIEPVYQQYCPMKKMYWLSSETAIKNPYYGKMMLTCGKVTETIN